MGIYDNSPDSIKELKERNISTECPFCGDRVSLVPAHKPISFGDNSYFVAFCPTYKKRNCKPIFAVYQSQNDFIQERYPIPTFKASMLNEVIPESIREDFAEASRCLYVDSFKAVVVLCRRVVESVAVEKLQAEAKDAKGMLLKLYMLIDRLRKDGFITKDLADSAHEVRHFGNYGAHFQDDDLEKVTRKEAEDTREVTGQFLHFIYLAPAKTRELRDARNAKRKT